MKKRANRHERNSPSQRGPTSESARGDQLAAIDPIVDEQPEHGATPRVNFWPGRTPFTAAIILKFLENGVLKRQAMPSMPSLNQLAWELNDIHGIFWYRKTRTPESDAKQKRAMKVRDAIETLSAFFEERKGAWRSIRGTATSKIIKRERELYKEFDHFVLAMQTHVFELDMDVDDVVLMPRHESWRHIANVVAGSFKNAMLPQELGLSNNGPLARFVAAVMPLMTGEHPSIVNVAKHLKDTAAARAKAYQQGQH
jgi:hypothetical protein